MNSSTSDLPLDAAPPLPNERIWPALTIAPLLVLMADYLFWRPTPGLPFGLYFCLAAIVVLFLHAPAGRRRRPAIACGLMFLASVATALETSLTNTIVLAALLAVVVGESCYREVVGTAWARWSEALAGWLCSLGRWPWFFRRLSSSALVSVGLSKANTDVVARSLQAIAPAACLGIVFLVVFQMGNAVFSQFCGRISNAVLEWIQNFDFSFGHLVFWLAISTVALVLVQPRKPGAQPRFWTRQWSRVVRTDRTVAVWQSRFILFVLNALFFTVNTIDVSYLWQHAKLPEGVSFSQFVHSGVYSLIFAVLLSAVVLAAMFQQSLDIARGRGLKALALLWIGQNLLLIAGVVLRLKLYVDAYQLSELRVYVGCFLLLVTCGFVLLAWHVVREGSLNGLIFRNVLAIFTLFFVLQFLDVAGFVAEFNVGQWRSNRSRTLDFKYLESLGPGGWAALCSVASTTDRVTSDVIEARERVVRLAGAEIERRAQSDWRSYQSRRASAGQQVIRTAARVDAAVIFTLAL
ncbi:MAG: DUF4173 domain-containing protein [Chthoniobacter sp.]|uniref:DUF4153 domain-containing protein n=1 Tax=Chthoniobacter sp. TaxID=2510640 RepID=UPI0032AE1243